MKRDKIGMGYELLHTMELLSVQCLQVDDVIPIFSPVLVGVVLKDLQLLYAAQMP